MESTSSLGVWQTQHLPSLVLALKPKAPLQWGPAGQSPQDLHSPQHSLSRPKAPLAEIFCHSRLSSSQLPQARGGAKGQLPNLNCHRTLWNLLTSRFQVPDWSLSLPIRFRQGWDFLTISLPPAQAEGHFLLWCLKAAAGVQGPRRV